MCVFLLLQQLRSLVSFLSSVVFWESSWSLRMCEQFRVGQRFVEDLYTDLKPPLSLVSSSVSRHSDTLHSFFGTSSKIIVIAIPAWVFVAPYNANMEKYQGKYFWNIDLIQWYTYYQSHILFSFFLLLTPTHEQFIVVIYRKIILTQAISPLLLELGLHEGTLEVNNVS